MSAIRILSALHHECCDVIHVLRASSVFPNGVDKVPEYVRGAAIPVLLQDRLDSPLSELLVGVRAMKSYKIRPVHLN